MGMCASMMNTPAMASMMGSMMGGGGAAGGKGGGGSWGPASSSGWQNNADWKSTPYDDKLWEQRQKRQKEWEQKQKEQEEAEKRWALKHKGPYPPVDWLPIASTCSIVQQGFPMIVPAMEYDKEKQIFSEAHGILQDFFSQGGSLFPLIKDKVDIEHDYDGTAYPEVHQAWKGVGNDENSCTIAECKTAGQWGIGFGGKKNGERAAKLALSLAMITTADANTVARVTTD